MYIHFPWLRCLLYLFYLTRRIEKWENKKTEWVTWEPWALQLLYCIWDRMLQLFSHYSFISDRNKTFWNEAHCILYYTYQLHVWDPRPLGHKHQSCSRLACGPDQAQRDTNVGTTFPRPMHGHAPWTDRPEGRWETMGREVWGGFAAWRGSLQHGCSNSSASQRLLGLKLLPAPPRENKMEREKWRWWKED